MHVSCQNKYHYYLHYFLICLFSIILSLSYANSDESVNGSIADNISIIDFIPQKPPEGWSMPQNVQLYGTLDQPAENGTIFDYINGGGVVYVDHGLIEVAHANFIFGKSGPVITIDIFDMGTSANADAAFSDEIICPDGYTASPVIAHSKEYHYSPDYFMYFRNGRYLVYLNVNDDRKRETAERLAVSIHRLISRGGKNEIVH